ncbi:MAG: hypothetical protein HYY02_07855 [Chloroflexi bacterium]|nr:hypothetical protein [Chloroflexota bacterium]
MTRILPLRYIVAVLMVALVLLLPLAAQVTAVAAHGTTITVSPFKATGYKFKVVDWGAGAGFEQPGYDASSFSTGDAGFGTTSGGCSWNNSTAIKTSWPANTDLLLRKELTLPAGAHSLRVRGTVDNDATVYLNGQLLGSVQSGFCHSPNIDFTAPDSLLLPGTNLLAIRGHDYGGATYLDVEVLVHSLGDTTPPTVSCSATPSVLWPPNHKLAPVSVNVQATDASGIASVVLVAVTSNEPDDGLGDGDTANDIQGWAVGTSDTSGMLRAERSGSGNGRVYRLFYTATDNAGNSASCSATVSVPHDRG